MQKLLQFPTLRETLKEKESLVNSLATLTQTLTAYTFDIEVRLTNTNDWEIAYTVYQKINKITCLKE